jgi:hypothetical protein
MSTIVCIIVSFMTTVVVTATELYWAVGVTSVVRPVGQEECYEFRI